MTNATDKKAAEITELDSVKVSNQVMATALNLFLKDRNGVCVHVPIDFNNPQLGSVPFLVYNANMTMNIEPTRTFMAHGQTFVLNKPTLN